MLRSSLSVFLGAIALFAPDAWSAVRVVDATEKVRPTATVAGTTSANLRAARNEFEPFQIVVEGGAVGLSGVGATASPLVGSGGTIAASNVRLYRLGYQNVITASNDEGGTGRWPDPLIPDVDEVANEKRNAFPFDVPAGENRVIWVDVHVPKTAAPGVYTGTIAVEGLGLPTLVPVTLAVLDFELPSTSTLPTTYGMAWNHACVAHHGSYEGCGYDAGILQMNTMYAAFMLDHRISGEVAYTGPKASSSGGYNWAGFDPHYAPLMDGTASGMILQGAKLTSFRYRWYPNTVATYQEWATHLRQKGWFSRTYDYTCDEPPMTCAWSDIPTRAAAVHAGDPDMRTLVTTNIAHAMENGVDDDIDVLVPVINHLHDRSGKYAGDRRAEYAAFLASDAKKELWWYQSCMSHGCGHQGGAYFNGWASVMVDASGTQNRAMQWLTYLYDIEGELYFETLLQLANAWNSVYDFGGNGDGTLLYPGTPSRIGGTTHVPVSSYRLKMIREGMEDYEYLKRLDQLGDATFARTVAKTLFPSPYETRQPAQKVREARDLIINRIVELTAVEPPPPPPPPPSPEFVQALSARAAVSVDGDLSEFAGAPVVALSGESSGSAATAQVRMLWDDERLYVAFEVQDATMRVNAGGRDGEVWDGDGVEVMVDVSANGSAAPDGDDFHVGVNILGDLRDEVGGGAPWDPAWTGEVEHAIVQRDTQYAVELSIPWASMGVTPSAGTTLGFDVAVNDSDAPGVVKAFDWANLRKFAQPSAWNRLVLGPRPATPESSGPVVVEPRPPEAPVRTGTVATVGCAAGGASAGAWPWAIGTLVFFGWAAFRRRRAEH